MKDKKAPTGPELFQPEQNPVFLYLIDEVTTVYYDLLVKYKYNDMDVSCLKKRLVQLMLFDELKMKIRDFLTQEYKHEWMQATQKLNSILHSEVQEWLKDGKIQQAPVIEQD